MKQLRSYQQDAIDAVINALNRNVNSCLVVIPTGGGKTFMTVQLIEKLGHKRGLWITDRDELITQSALAFIRSKFDERFSNMVEQAGFSNYIRDGGLFAGSDFKMGLIKADVFQPYGNVVMASAQTLHKKLSRFKPDEFEYVIVDEAHCFMAKTYAASVNYFTPKLLLGLTATKYRGDNLPLGNIFDELVYEYEMRQAIKDGYLCEMDGVKIKTTTNLDSVHTLGGEFNQKELANEVNTLSRNFLVADSYLKYAKGRQGIFFAVDIQHTIDLEEAFKAKGINATAVSSNEELTGDRSQKIKDFKNGIYDVIINVNLLTTGFDHPNTGVIGCAAPTKSKTKYVQSIGRGSRLKDEAFVSKFGQNCIILDFVDNTTKHNLINCAELDKGLDPEDRVFITQEKREKLEESRRVAKIKHVQKEDEKVNLFAIPKLKISTSYRMKEVATPAQLASIEKMGYDIVNIVFTKAMISEIFSQQRASDKHISFLKWKGYDVSGFISHGQAIAASREIEERAKINNKF